VQRYQGVDYGDNYNGLMKLSLEGMVYNWFEKVIRHDMEFFIFERIETVPGSGDWYFHIV
jgi:hypothetical protein